MIALLIIAGIYTSGVIAWAGMMDSDLLDDGIDRPGVAVASGFAWPALACILGGLWLYKNGAGAVVAPARAATAHRRTRREVAALSDTVARLSAALEEANRDRADLASRAYDLHYALRVLADIVDGAGERPDGVTIALKRAREVLQ
ncbi:MAG: hypothetical protein ACSLE9_09105 [Burkholderiaceae bacterium]